MKTVLRKIDTTTGQCVETRVLKGCATDSVVRGYKYSHVIIDRSASRFNKFDDSDVVYVYTRKNSKYHWYMIHDWGFVCVSDTAPADIPEPVASAPADIPEPVASAPADIPEPVASAPADIPEPVASAPAVSDGDIPDEIINSIEFPHLDIFNLILDGGFLAFWRKPFAIPFNFYFDEFEFWEWVDKCSGLGYFYNPRDQN